MSLRIGHPTTVERSTKMQKREEMSRWDGDRDGLSLDLMGVVLGFLNLQEVQRSAGTSKRFMDGIAKWKNVTTRVDLGTFETVQKFNQAFSRQVPQFPRLKDLRMDLSFCSWIYHKRSQHGQTPTKREAEKNDKKFRASISNFCDSYSNITHLTVTNPRTGSFSELNRFLQVWGKNLEYLKVTFFQDCKTLPSDLREKCPKLKEFSYIDRTFHSASPSDSWDHILLPQLTQLTIRCDFNYQIERVIGYCEKPDTKLAELTLILNSFPIPKHPVSGDTLKRLLTSTKARVKLETDRGQALSFQAVKFLIQPNTIPQFIEALGEKHLSIGGDKKALAKSLEESLAMQDFVDMLGPVNIFGLFYKKP